LRRTDIYHHVLHPLEIPNQLYVLPSIPGLHLRFFLSRDRDFDDDTVEIFRLLADHTALAYQHARNYTWLQNIQPTDEEKLARLGLTPREEEVLHWIHEGKRNGEIAIILKLSKRTVEKHVERILRKLNAETRTSAAIQAGAFLRPPNS
jgi:DNA-binding NarL/FixJ family response regulator